MTAYKPPYIRMLIIIGFVNILFTTYFISVILAGVVFKIFLDAVDKKYNYLFLFSIFTFLIIEVSQGFRLFSLSLISLFLYYFIIPRLKHIFSSSIMVNSTYIFSFYLSMTIMVQLFDKFNLDTYFIFLFNFGNKNI